MSLRNDCKCKARGCQKLRDKRTKPRSKIISSAKPCCPVILDTFQCARNKEILYSLFTRITTFHSENSLASIESKESEVILRIPVSNRDLQSSLRQRKHRNTAQFSRSSISIPDYVLIGKLCSVRYGSRRFVETGAHPTTSRRYGNAYSRRMCVVDPSLKSTKVDIETLLAVRVSKRIRGGERRTEAREEKKGGPDERKKRTTMGRAGGRGVVGGVDRGRASEIKGALLITVSTGVTGPREASAFLRRTVKCPWYSAPGNIFRLRLSKDPALTFHLTKTSAPLPRSCLAFVKSDKTTARHATAKIAISSQS